MRQEWDSCADDHSLRRTVRDNNGQSGVESDTTVEAHCRSDRLMAIPRTAYVDMSHTYRPPEETTVR
jgi:hypothetical protein